MAQPTNTFDTYDAVGQREDLTDVIYNISPSDSPFISMIGRTTAKNTLHEWQTDSLASVDGANAQIDGDDASGTAITATTRVNNRCQISRKVVVISGSAEATDKAGRKSEMAYNMAKKAKELKRDMETIVCGSQVEVAGNATTARKTRGLESWLLTNKGHGSGGATNSSTGVVTDGTQRSATEALLKAQLQTIYTAGGEPTVIMVGPSNKQTFSGFSGIATQYRDNRKVGPAKIIASADIYVSDFGEMSIVPNRFSRDRTATIIQPDMWAMSYLRPFRKEKLAKNGDSDRVMLIAEYALEARNEASSGKLADLS